MSKKPYFEIKFLDVRKKWLDNTKTTIELILYDYFDIPTVVSYVHTDEDIKIAKKNKEKYIDLMLKTIKENII